MIRHPTDAQLNRFADGVLDRTEQATVAAHLAMCARCRNTVAAIRELTARAGALPHIEPPPGGLDRILATGAAGERVIRPVAAVKPVGRGRRMPGLVAAGAALAVAAASLLLAVRLGASATAGELTFSPRRPGIGDTVRVEYVSHPMFGGADHLLLRARYRTPTTVVPAHLVAARLRRERGRTFHGRFVLPDSVVFAAFAVEDTLGAQIDDNRGQLWDFVVRNDRGVPTLDGLVQQSNDVNGRNQHRAYRTAREAADLYPESPLAWTTLQAAETMFQWGGGDVDSATAYHRAQLRRLDSALARQADLSAGDMAWMVWYAQRLDSVVYRRWKARLYEAAPGHPRAVQRRAMDAMGNPSDAALLEQMEDLWRRFGNVHDLVPRIGYRAARGVGDPDLILRWARRIEPTERWGVIIDLLSRPELRQTGTRWARDYLASLDSSVATRRDLRRTVGEQRVRDTRIKRPILLALGEALLDAGAVDTGLDSLDRATDAGWDAELFRRVGDVKLALHDTTGALEAYANAAVAPDAGAATVDSVLQVATSLLSRGDWDELRERSMSRMIQRTLAEERRQAIVDEVELLDARDNQVSLGQLTRNGRISFLIFWGFVGDNPMYELERLQQIADRLAERDVNVLAVLETGTPYPTEPEGGIGPFLQERNLTIDVYRDTRGQTRRGLMASGTPSYFILDEEGFIRFRPTSLDDVLRQVAVLEMIRSPAPVVE